MIETTKVAIRKRFPPLGDYRTIYISVVSAVIGIFAGFLAFGLYKLIAFLSNLIFFQQISFVMPSLQANHLGIWVVFIPALGGLIVGLMAKYGTEKIRGHGIPEAMEAIITERSRISPRVALFKPISAAIAIGSGGPFGAEGPIIQTGGALGSLFGQFLHTTAAERKILLACGAAAGMAATFNTPIAAVILAIELLLFEFKSRSFIPLVIASTMATTVRFALLGRNTLFQVAPLDFSIPMGLPFYIVLGLICGVAAVLFSGALYRIEDYFERLPFDWMWWPMLGGLAVGILGLIMPRILGVGYDTISDILNARLPLQILAGIMILKSLALLVSLGSGTSGGLLAPMFMVGSAMGGAFALLMNRLFPGAHLAPGAFALVAMAAFFGSAARVPFTMIIFAFEITHETNSILPLMLVAVIAESISILLSRNSIMTEKLARRGLHISHDYETDVFRQVSVGEVMRRNPVTLPCTLRLSELADRIARNDPVLARPQAFPILDENGDLAGIISRSDILRKIEEQPLDGMTVQEAGSDQILVAYPDELVQDAVNRMLSNDIGRLPVVSRQDPKKLLGMLGRAEVLNARARRIHEESVREPGWIPIYFRRDKLVPPIWISEEEPASQAGHKPQSKT